jgi:hypothetical protein
MKLKLVLAACLAAAVFPMASAGAAEGIPGICHTYDISPSGDVTHTTSECECLASVEDVQVTPTRHLLVTYCVARTGLEGGGR